MPTALITGTTSGFGKTLAEYLLQRGWQVIGFARGKAVVDHLAYIHYTIDIRNPDEVVSVTKLIPKIDLLVNNAAVFSTQPLTKTLTKTINDIIDTNVKGTMYVTKECINIMVPGGKIIFINSVAGLAEIENQSIYCASKYAITAFAGVLGKELRPIIHVASIHPGGINTPLWNDQNPYTGGDVNSLISPEEIAKLVEFIYFGKAEYKTIKMFPTIEWH